MSSQVGAEGMEKIEYIGEQVDSTWTGDFTGAIYHFGKDRPRGWVDKRDLGSRDDSKKRGFLAKKDKYSGKWLFNVVNGKSSIQEVVEPVGTPVVSKEQTPEPVVEVSNAVVSATATGIPKKEQPIFDPENMTVEQVKTELEKSGYTKVQVEGIYRSEMANRNRKGLIAYLEERIANWETSGM